MFMAFIGVLAILFGGSSASSGGGDILGAIASFIAGVLCLALIYGYWCLGVLFFFWLFEAIGYPGLAPLGLILPIIIPMLVASAIHGILFWLQVRKDRATESAEVTAAHQSHNKGN